MTRTHSLFCLAGILALAVGCDSEDAEPSDDGTAGAEERTMEYEDTPYFEGERYILADTYVNIMKEMKFVGTIEPGVAIGFDLDGQTSEPGEQDSCNHGDLEGPNGEPGIDNQLAKVWAQAEPLIGDAASALLQGAINEGRVLIMLELVAPDGLEDGAEVVFNTYRGKADPEIGTFGYITPDQTFDYDYGSPISTAEPAVIEDGVLVAGPLLMQLPINILELDIVANVYGGMIRIEIHEDGSYTGFLGGALSVDEVLGAILETNAAEEGRLVEPLFRNNADMGYEDGRCGLFSVGVEFQGAPAFVIRDAAEERERGM
jgi:hypothetical protein